TRALVMGVVPPEAATPREVVEVADRLCRDGADVVEVGGGVEGDGGDDRLASLVEALVMATAVPVAVVAGRADRLAPALAAGAVLACHPGAAGETGPSGGSGAAGARGTAGGAAPSGASGPAAAPGDVAGPGYLEAVAAAGATVALTGAGPTLVAVRDGLVEQARRAEAAGIARRRIVLGAGLDRLRPAAALELLRATDRLALLGYPLLLSPPGHDALGALLALEPPDRPAAGLAAVALGVTRGCRIVRASADDVRGARRVCDVVAAVLEAP
ncbi:MAG TPA: hypothetical protein VFO65_00735, partial [Acidimicrobiales bacterium]|nr:hypothetical protein [Acidimicrobiales bacterium]